MCSVGFKWMLCFLPKQSPLRKHECSRFQTSPKSCLHNRTGININLLTNPHTILCFHVHPLVTSQWFGLAFSPKEKNMNRARSVKHGEAPQNVAFTAPNPTREPQSLGLEFHLTNTLDPRLFLSLIFQSKKGPIQTTELHWIYQCVSLLGERRLPPHVYTVYIKHPLRQSCSPDSNPDGRLGSFFTPVAVALSAPQQSRVCLPERNGNGT